MKKRYPLKFGGNYDFVDVRDVANGIILAAKNGKRGESYILGGNNITIAALFEIVAGLCGFKPPRYNAPVWLLRAVAPLTETWSRLFKRTPTFTRYSLQTLLSNSNISSAKAKTDLGYSSRPIAATLADCIKWSRKESVSFS